MSIIFCNSSSSSAATPEVALALAFVFTVAFDLPADETEAGTLLFRSRCTLLAEASDKLGIAELEDEEDDAEAEPAEPGAPAGADCEAVNCGATK